MAIKEYSISHHKIKTACSIIWESEKYDINSLEPFVCAIQCDDGEDFYSLQLENKDFENEEIRDFEAISDDNKTFSLCFTCWVTIDLEKHPNFKKGLEKANNKVVARINFSKDGKPILNEEGEEEYLFEMDEDNYVDLYLAE